MNASMGALVKTLYVFPYERLLVARERAIASYGMLPYLAAKLAAELPIASAYPVVFSTILYPLAKLNP